MCFIPTVESPCPQGHPVPKVTGEWRRPERSVAGPTRLQPAAAGVCIKHPVGDHHYPMALVGRRPAGPLRFESSK